MIYAAGKSILFRMDAEKAHDIVVGGLSTIERRAPFVVTAIQRLLANRISAPVELWGLQFRSPLGIAAGFDKNARMIPILAALGFGFVEVGTVTLRPQPGNPRPRLFRIPESRAIINRMGFNSDGADVVRARLMNLWKRAERRGTEQQLPPVFVNIGKNKDVAIDDAVESYAACYSQLAPLADGVVVNVSSPNTPSLRDLQGAAHLRAILERLRELRGSIEPRREGSHPILVKIAPDLGPQQLESLAEVVVALADGVVATNTTIGRDGVARHAEEAGGLSGAPLASRSTEVVRELRRLAGDRYPIIGVGGVFTADDVRRKLDAGANLVQTYTGFIYEGPLQPYRIGRELSKKG